MKIELESKLSDKQFSFIQEYLASKYGLKVPKEKRVLVESRLNSRLNALRFEKMEDYINHTFNPEKPNDEYKWFVHQLTTHKTFFFRETYQFDYLSEIVGPYLERTGSSNPLTVWSAGCSTGEEVYTLAMTLEEKKAHLRNLDYRIVGTDISVPSLQQAATGVFRTELENLPEKFKEKYFTHAIENGRPSLTFNNADIKKKIQLGMLNLNSAAYNLPYNFDFIFCRNVTIYFDAATRAEVLRKIVSKLKPGGYLFLGHSETALGLTLPIKGIRPTIYQKIA